MAKIIANTGNKNLGLNMYTYPKSVFQKMNDSTEWEFIWLEEKNNSFINKPIGVMFCYKNKDITYVPSLIGIDYEYNQTYQTYRQLLFESIWRANKMDYQKVDFGVSANFEKRKLGASVIPKFAYIQSNSNFKMDYFETQL